MDSNNKNNKVVVVEGYHDLSRLREIYPNLDVVVTNGSEISYDKLSELKQLNEKRGLILLLDPDVPGERIRRIIQSHVGETAHAFIPKENCISKNGKKVGIEHASKEDIMNALSSFKLTQNPVISNLTMQDLFDLKLTSYPNAKQLRSIVSKELGIGLVNGKTLLRKLQMFGVTIEELQHIVSR